MPSSSTSNTSGLFGGIAGLGLFAPPLGVGYYAACAIGHVNPDVGIRPIVGYMIALLIGVIIVAAVPWISIGFL